MHFFMPQFLIVTIILVLPGPQRTMTIGSDFLFVDTEIVRDQLYQLTVCRSCVARQVSSQKDEGSIILSHNESLKYGPGVLFPSKV